MKLEVFLSSRRATLIAERMKLLARDCSQVDGLLGAR